MRINEYPVCAIHAGKVYIIEVNPRASRTVPFVSKAIGAPLAQLATGCMLGKSLVELGFTEEMKIPCTIIKEAVFPFIKFPGADVMLSSEMHSTGEVMGTEHSTGLTYLKSQLAAGNKLPTEGNIFLSIKKHRQIRRHIPCKRSIRHGIQNIRHTRRLHSVV